MIVTEKLISFILTIILLMTVDADDKPCTMSGSGCQHVRMPLISNNLQAPLVAELDITSINKQLKAYIDDDIKSTFSDDVLDMVKNEQEQMKTFMLDDYSSKLNNSKKEYDKKMSNIVQNLEDKQENIRLEISEVYRNLSKSESNFNTEITNLFSGFEHRQESLKLAMLSEYLSKIEKLQEDNSNKINDLASDLKSQFANLSQELEGKITTHLQIQRKEFKEWRINLTESLNESHKERKNRDCTDIEKNSYLTVGNGVYKIYPDGINLVQAYCDMSTDGGGWTVIQKRFDGSVDFNRNWLESENGFGNIDGEFWFGNLYMHTLTATGRYELRIDMVDKYNYKEYAVYKDFSIGDAASKYRLTVGDYSGNAGDSLKYHNGHKFSAKDQDNDTWAKHCISHYQGGPWWYNEVCYHADLNKPFGNMVWGRAISRSVMMIRKI